MLSVGVTGNVHVIPSNSHRLLDMLGWVTGRHWDQGSGSI